MYGSSGSSGVLKGSKTGRAEELIKSSLEKNEKAYKKFSKQKAWA